MENPLYHVLLDGRRVGPYDRRTIVGMRIKKMLNSRDVVVAGNGRELTVGDLVGGRRFDDGGSHGNTHSVVQAVYSAWLAGVAGPGFTFPRFKGELELRVQTRVLRISGRFRLGFRWRQGRVKVPLEQVAHARARGSMVDLALKADGGVQRVALELFTPEAAQELVGRLPQAGPWPQDLPAADGKGGRGGHPQVAVWGAVLGGVVAVGAMVVWIVGR